MNTKIFDALSEALKTGEPVVLATVIRGVENEIGRHLFVRRDGSAQGEIDEPTLVAHLKEHAAALFGQEGSDTLRDG
ncbi:MAG: XdhC family protein, partial [bacterium]